MAAFDEKDYTKSFDWSIWKRLTPFVRPFRRDFVGMLVFNGLCGYALGVVKMRGHKLIWSLLMALLLVPSTGGFVVLYRSFVQLGINQGQIWPLYLGSGGSPFTIMKHRLSGSTATTSLPATRSEMLRATILPMALATWPLLG